ncbi:putative SOS response-associated peptidase YedK [Halarchaeum solikamskense]|uniref:SOS response-associated peptidase n=1 Tax=Halarchaeum nitratireducens TaxID=489913 RepID=UPI001B3AAE13|nr:SOS response-associated peptidase [Halarchaeum solikamskense]MBP2250784.1 putative SOS response-associated peptidase YedK [Halarchaeum solikamskense]
MCGRYALFSDHETLARRFDVETSGYEPTYNAAPSQSLPVIADDDPGTLRAFQWGLVPPWADDASPGPINARVETVREKPTFAESLEERRCLVPCDGFYEWREEGGTKRPYYFHRPDGEPFAMAGIWAMYEPETTQTGLDAFGAEGSPDRAADPVRSFAVLTRDATGTVADYHHRESVLLAPEEESRWLSAEYAGLLDRANDVDLVARPVSRAVNDPANDRPDLVETV